MGKTILTTALCCIFRAAGLMPHVAMNPILLKPTSDIGVIPYSCFDLENEDSLAVRLSKRAHKDNTVDVAVIHLEHLSNFTDFLLGRVIRRL